ncbi:MAG TPA: M28 family metallopeptidase [Candidatus Acidoferrales bacterium]
MSASPNHRHRLSTILRISAIGIILCATTVLARAHQSTEPDWQAEGNAWWAHVQFLASDDMRGRDTGSDGHRRAAEYVAKQFADAGLQPGGTNGFLQPIDFETHRIDEANSSLSLERAGKTEALQLGPDATLRVSGDPAPSVKAQAVFVGYGFAVPEMGYDEFAGQDLHGKIAVFITGGPTNIPGPLKAHYQSAEQRWEAMQKAGAIGFATIGNPKNSDIPWSRASLARLNPSMSIADPKTRGTGPHFAASINPAQADKWFADSGHTIAELLAIADKNELLPKFPLKVTVHAKVEVVRAKVTSPNVIGILPGADLKLKNEYVVISAHLDHIGVGQPINGDSIYNGAMDNASGVASLIEVAKHIKAAGIHPRRSLIFAAVTAEEKGDLGSEYFAHHPTVPQKEIVADLNMDMFLPLFRLQYLEVQGLDESTLGDDVRAVAEGEHVIIQADKEPERNRFIRSDQYSFVKVGIPALAFKFGWIKGTDEEKIFQDWIKTRYHAPSDDLDQPVDTPAAAHFDHLLLLLTTRVADADTRPTWKPDSFFKRFAQ